MLSRYSIVIEKDDIWYVAYCVELGIASQGKTIDEAENNIREAIELYMESFHPKADIVKGNDKVFMTIRYAMTI